MSAGRYQKEKHALYLHEISGKTYLILSKNKKQESKKYKEKAL